MALGNRIAVFPGTFDPIHWGHIDVLETAARLFDRVIWAIAENPGKKTMFTEKQRMTMMQVMVHARNMENVIVTYSPAFLVDICQNFQARYIVRSFRMTADFEYEMQMAFANAKLDMMINTVFIPTRQHHMHISSTLVRELIKAKRKADLYECVPPILIDEGYFFDVNN